MKEQDISANQYEQKYQKGYGCVYPEGHIIRVHKHIIEWELGIFSGNIFDFGCGAGTHLLYFTERGFTPFGCDASETAINQSRELMPEYADNFVVVNPTCPNLHRSFGQNEFTIFQSNQVLYYLEDKGIREIVDQAHTLLQSGGVFIASMMSYSCWFARYIIDDSGDFKEIELATDRLKERTFINLKKREELEDLFTPFKKLHIGSYGAHIREEEGSSDHWLYVGIKE